MDYYKPDQIGFIRHLSKDGKKLVITLLFKIIKSSLPLNPLPNEVLDQAETELGNYLNEGFVLIVINYLNKYPFS